MSTPRIITHDDQAIPGAILDVKRLPVKTKSDSWRLHEPTKSIVIDWTRLDGCDADAVFALKWHVIRTIETRSPQYALSVFRMVGDYLIYVRDVLKVEVSDKVSLLNYLGNLRQRSIEWQFHHVRKWYTDSTDRLLNGFDDETAFALLDLTVAGGEKGVAVLSLDPEEGPLSPLEEMALRRALIKGHGHVQQRAATWLSLSHGFNPATMSLMREEDFETVEFEGLPPAHFLKAPQIKKRALPRSKFRRRNIDQRLASVLIELIAENKRLYPDDGTPRPLFRLPYPRPTLVGGPYEEYAYHYTSQGITRLIRDCVLRMGVKSPRTGDYLWVTTRRLRYTYACKKVQEGIRKRVLADLLGHSDTQNVQVYYAPNARFTERIDGAIAVEIGPLVGAFMGTVVTRPRGGTDEIPFRDLPSLGQCGADFVCGLAPHRTCYTCTKFKPYSDGPHAAVLDELLTERAELLEADNPRMATQLDETILAVGQVIDLTKVVK